MFKFWKIEKRHRAIIMRENMARRTFIRANPQYGPFRPTDIHECYSDSDDEPTISVAPAASDVPTAAPGRSSQPIARIDRALDVLNAPGSTRQEFQAYFNPRKPGGGDLEELSPEVWEEFRLDGAADEYDLHMQDLADEEAQGLPRVGDGNQGHHMVDLIMLHWLDVMFHTSLILLELTLSQ